MPQNKFKVDLSLLSIAWIFFGALKAYASYFFNNININYEWNLFPASSLISLVAAGSFLYILHFFAGLIALLATNKLWKKGRFLVSLSAFFSPICVIHFVKLVSPPNILEFHYRGCTAIIDGAYTQCGLQNARIDFFATITISALIFSFVFLIWEVLNGKLGRQR